MTTIRGADNVRQYFPNTMMTGAAIINLSRSDNKFDSFTVCASTMCDAEILLACILSCTLPTAKTHPLPIPPASALAIDVER